MGKSWLPWWVCHTYSLLGAFCCSHRMRMLIYACIQTSNLSIYHCVRRLSPKSVQETPTFKLRRATCSTYPWPSGSLRYPVYITSWEFGFLQKSASKSYLNLDFKEGIVFSIVANLSLKSKIVNDFSLYKYDLVWWWWLSHDSDCPCLQCVMFLVHIGCMHLPVAFCRNIQCCISATIQ